jgi:hypothetical protein
MNKADYEIRRTGTYLIISRIVFPRIKVYLCRKRHINEIVRIKLLDKCPASDVAPAIYEIDQLVSDLYPFKYDGKDTSVSN